MARRNSDSGRLAVIWLATAFIVVIGAAATALVIFAGTDQREVPFLVWGGCFSGLILILILSNIRWEEPINQLKFWLSFQDRSDPTDLYRAARRRANSRDQYGSNAPPSVDSVRDAADHGGAWVPRSSTRNRPPESR